MKITIETGGGGTHWSLSPEEEKIQRQLVRLAGDDDKLKYGLKSLNYDPQFEKVVHQPPLLEEVVAYFVLARELGTPPSPGQLHERVVFDGEQRRRASFIGRLAEHFHNRFG